MSTILRFFFTVGLLLMLAGFSSTTYAGDLTPPGAPASTMKTLDEVEARTPIHAVELPLTIDQPGSYYFAENIQFDVPQSNAIQVSVSNVTIDLNGYTLSGPGIGSGTGGSGIAIAGLPEAVTGIRVLNGTVQKFAGIGVDLGDGSRVSDIQSNSNGEGGINTGENSVVWNNSCINIGGNPTVSSTFGIETDVRSRIEKNLCSSIVGAAGIRTDGIRTRQGCLIQDNTTTSIQISGGGTATVSGIRAEYACIIENNICYSVVNNGIGYAYGIRVSDKCTISNNHCSYITGEVYFAAGISCSGDCVISDNQVSTTGTTSDPSGEGYGIYTLTQCKVLRNQCETIYAYGEGPAAGIRVSSYCRVDSNHVGDTRFADTQCGILVIGDDTIVISNTAYDNAHYDIQFGTYADNNYYAANITEKPVQDDGTGNTAGTTPAPNVTY